MAKTSPLTSRDESREMMALWPDIVRDLTDGGRFRDVPDATKWLVKVKIFLILYKKNLRCSYI